MWTTERWGLGYECGGPFCSFFGVPKRSFVFILKKIAGTQKEFLNWSDYFNSNISPSMIIINRLENFFLKSVVGEGLSWGAGNRFILISESFYVDYYVL